MKKKPNTSNLKVKKVIALTLVTSMLAAIGTLAIVLYKTRLELNGIIDVKIAHLVVAAVEGLSQPVPEDPQTGERYISVARLRLPASDQMDRQLLYSYSPAAEDFKAELNIASRSAVGQTKSKVLSGSSLNETFERIPEYQACSRGFRITFEPLSEAESPLTFEKKLSDGRSVYVYANSGCERNRDSMTEYLQQIDSY